MMKLKDEQAILVFFIIGALGFQLITATVDSVIFHENEFVKELFFMSEPVDVFLHVFIMTLFLVFGVIFYKLASKRRHALETLQVSEFKVRSLYQRLQETEKRYHSLFDKAPLGIVVVDPEKGSIIEFNEEAHKQLGYGSEEFSKLSVFDYQAFELEDETKQNLKQVLVEGKNEWETKHCTKNGELRDVIVTSHAIQISDKTYVLSIHLDKTEAKKVEAALKESESKYRMIVELAQEGICAIDLDNCVIFANSKMLQLLGCQENEVLSKNLLGFIEKQSLEQINQKLKDKTTSSVRRCDVELVPKTGANIYSDLTLSPIYDDSKIQIGTLVMFADITERKKMEKKLGEYSSNLEELVKKKIEQLNETQAKLVKSQRLAAIGELAGMVGHDLRNPLAGIKNALFFLKKKKTVTTEQGKQMLEILGKCVEHSDKIINDLLEYSKDIHLDLEEVSLHKLIIEASASINVPGKIKVIADFSDKATLRVDVGKMHRVFVNLFKNAIDAMPEGGTISVTSKHANGYLDVDFGDTGTGIPEDVVSKLFNPLFTTKAQGMGFGLAICKRIIEAHGGTITVVTTMGKGTTFKVRMPAEQKITSQESLCFQPELLSSL